MNFTTENKQKQKTPRFVLAYDENEEKNDFAIKTKPNKRDTKREREIFRFFFQN